MLSGAQVAKPNCARYIRSSRCINGVSGTGAQIISGWRLYTAPWASFAQVGGDGRRWVGLICKKVCPCARLGSSKAPGIPGGKRRVAARTANNPTRTESVLWGVRPAQIAAQIAPRAAAACFHRLTRAKMVISLVAQYGFSTDSEVGSCACMSSSSGVNTSASTGSTLFFGLASLCANRARVSAGRCPRGVLSGPHMQKPVLPVLSSRQQSIHN